MLSPHIHTIWTEPFSAALYITDQNAREQLVCSDTFAQLKGVILTEQKTSNTFKYYRKSAKIKAAQQAGATGNGTAVQPGSDEDF